MNLRIERKSISIFFILYVKSWFTIFFIYNFETWKMYKMWNAYMSQIFRCKETININDCKIEYYTWNHIYEGEQKIKLKSFYRILGHASNYIVL